MSSRLRPIVLRGICLLAVTVLTMTARAEDALPLSVLAANTHFHGIAVDPRETNRFYLATHHGVFVVDADGSGRRVSEDSNDYMGFTPHPVELMSCTRAATRSAGETWASSRPAMGGARGDSSPRARRGPSTFTRWT